MKTQRIGYIRVSSIDQNEQRQLDGIELDHVFTDTASGKDIERPQLQGAVSYAREGDTFICHSMDRLARNVGDMLRLVSELNERGVTVQFVKENMVFQAGSDDPHDPDAHIAVGLRAIRARPDTRAPARRYSDCQGQGCLQGRKPTLSPERRAELCEKAAAGVPRAKLARDYGISRETVYQYIRSIDQVPRDCAG